MKVLKWSGISAIIIMSCLSSCELVFNLFGHHKPKSVVYLLDLSFQGASGNEPVKGIGLKGWGCPVDIPEKQGQSGSVKDSLFILDIIVSEPCENWDNEIYNALVMPGFTPDVNQPGSGMNRSNTMDSPPLLSTH